MIELRSDTFTLPTPAMLRAAAQSELGNDGYGEDPTVLRLEKLASKLLGKEQACLMPSGTMANLALIKAHCTGSRNVVIVGDESDIYVYEQESILLWTDVVYVALATLSDGTIRISDLEQTFDEHGPSRVAVVCLENPHNLRGGVVLPGKYIQQVGEFVHAKGAKLHLDGARIFNAVVASQIDAAEIVRPTDSVQFCLSKGLAAPIGSLAVGNAELVNDVRAIRKMLGGTMRQAGVIAGPGIIALEEMVDRLAEDHLNARRLAQGLAKITGFELDLSTVQTNTVVFRVTDPRFSCESFIATAGLNGVNLSEFKCGRIRAVVHHGTPYKKITEALEILAQVIASGPAEDTYTAHYGYS